MRIEFLENKNVRIDVGFEAVPFNKGDVREIPDKIAKSLIADKEAKEVKVEKPKPVKIPKQGK